MLVKQQEAFEHELQQQLRRQVAAHTEHLKEALEEQRQELNRMFGLEVEKKIIEERAQHNAALSSSVAKLQGMEEYLKARDELDRLSQQAKGLWLACQGLRHTLVHGPASGTSGPQSLTADVQLVERAAPMSPYVPLVLASIPEEALTRGVYPEVALKERFAHVERTCRRVALVDDQRPSSLLRYLASYLQSLCVIYPKELPEEELADEQRVNPEMWDTFDVLSRESSMPVSDPGQDSPWSSSRPTESVPLQCFLMNGVSSWPVALVPTDGGAIEMEVFQEELCNITGHFLDISEVRRFGMTG
ncbi:hypothetical protein HPB51_019175 [Rhipicephalus microplus]|uniref:MICOS complex subunit MIC60 n=1 Tax=Rhipicephalus microplus TaxID=6941 RepID=A0A9J6DBB2_RHIMP|nr:hypothetical protein HPB51_019175 [Rhipicephalus microplus]